MTLKKILIFVFLFLAFTPFLKTNAQNTQAGFVPGSIWYSKDPFSEGDKIEIYTFIFNPDERELSGTVVIFDNNVYLGKKEFVLPPKTTKNIYINWTVTAGDHNIFAKIEDSKFLISPGKYERVYLAENETEKSPRTVSKKITSNNKESEGVVGITTDSIKEIIEEKTPEFILKPVVSTTEKIEDFRTKTANITGVKKEEVKKEIETLKNSSEKSTTSKTTKNTKEKENTTSNLLLKPFKYIQLFLLTLASFVLGTKVVFYGLILGLVFITFYFIWKKIF